MIPTRGEQVPSRACSPLRFHGQTQSTRTTLRTRPPLPPSDREYTPARSADRHRPEAHWRNPSILSPAVTATGTTRRRPSWCGACWRRSVPAAWRAAGLHAGGRAWVCVGRYQWMWWLRWTLGVGNLLGGWIDGPAAQTAGGMAWKTPWPVTLFGRWEARSATGAIMEPPVAKSRNPGVKISDERRASIGHRHGAARGTPWVDRRRKKKRKNYRRDRTGSAVVPM